MNEDLTFGQWLKRRRGGLGLTQKELAKRVDYSVETIRKVESDQARPSRQLAERLAETLEIAPAERKAFVRFARDEPLADDAQLPPTILAPESVRAPVSAGALPAPLSPFVGRQAEVIRLRMLLLQEEVRLVTVIGPGGVGKTRLALEVAALLGSSFSSGVRFVSLATTTAPEDVLPTIARGLGVKEQSRGAWEQALRAYLQDKELLLLLDNFEHVAAAAPLLAQLLAASSKLKILATSRAPLHLSWEHEFRLPPLLLPDPNSLPAYESLVRYDALALFAQRARAVHAGFTLSVDNAPVVAEICARLDGLPLAIELAAARTKLFTPQALLGRLERRLAFLTAGPHDLPPRHRGLRAAIEWSVDLLSPKEKRIFRRVSVFVGGCALQAAEAGYLTDGEPDPAILDVLASLVDKSLLVHEEGAAGEPRFNMLETVREYALEQLQAAGESKSVRDRHLYFFLHLAEETESGLRGKQQFACLDRLDTEYANLRAALDYGRQWPEHTERALRLASALYRFWWVRGYLTEGRHYLLQLLQSEQAPAVPPALRSTALTKAAALALWQGERNEALPLLAESEQLARMSDNRHCLAHALMWRGASYGKEEPEIAWELLAQSVALFREGGRPEELADALFWSGWVTDHQQPGSGRPFYQESIQLLRQVGDQCGLGLPLFGLGVIAMDVERNYGTARNLFEDSLSILRELGDKRLSAFVLYQLGLITRLEGDVDQALRYFEESMALHRETATGADLLPPLWQIAQLAVFQGNDERATALLSEGLAVARASGARGFTAKLLHLLGKIAYQRGAYEEARFLLQQSLDWYETLSHAPHRTAGLAGVRLSQGFIAHRLGDVNAAHALFLESLRLATELSEPLLAGLALGGLAAVRVDQGRVEEAVRWFAAASVLLASAPEWLDPVDAREFNCNLENARSRVGGNAFDAHWRAGRDMTSAQILAEIRELVAAG